MSRLVFLGSVAYLMVGIAQLVIGTVMEPMVHEYGVGYGDGGQLVMHQFLGGMTGVLCAPWLMRYLGKRGLLLTAISLIVVIQLVYATMPPWPVMLTVAPVTGFGFGITEATVGTFVIMAAAGNANKAMSRVEVFFGLGALLMPFVGAFLISEGIWKMSFVLVSVLAAVTLVLWLLYWPRILDAPPAAETNRSEPSASIGAAAGGSRLVSWTLIACILFFSAYVGLEMSFIHYLPSLLVQDNGVTEAAASLSISVYWAAMTIGRMTAGHAADRWGGASYLVFMCMANAVVFLLMISLHGTAETFVLTILSGLAMSGMFSIALVFANRAVRGAAERTTSLLMAAGGIGGALLPKLTGWFLDRFGPDETRWLFAGFGLLLLAVMLWAVSAARKSRPAVAANS